MTNTPRTLARTALGTAAAGALAFAGTTPALADDHRDRDGIGAGEIIAGALVIGGIAALAGAFDGDRGYDRRGYRDGYYRDGYRGDFYRGGPRGAVERCVRAAENQARRFGGYRYADVVDIRDIDRTRYGFRVKGRIEVEGQRGYRGRQFDRGRFTCTLDGRGAPLVNYKGIRGLR